MGPAVALAEGGQEGRDDRVVGLAVARQAAIWIVAAIAGSKVAGSQNMYHERDGPVHAELSAAMLCDSVANT